MVSSRAAPGTRLLFLAALLLFAALVFGGSAGAEPVQVRAAPHEGYGRVVFNWPAAVPYAAEMRGQQLTVTFGRPIEANLAAAVRILSGYLAGGEIAPNGLSVTFATTRAFGLRAFDLGPAVVVDLLDTDAPTASPPPAVPESASAQADAGRAPPPIAGREGPLLRVRSGEHEGYSRVVFDWPQTVGYSADRVGDSLTLVFDRKARPALKAIQTRPPRFLRGIGATTEEGRLVVSLRLPPGAGIRHFRSGTKVAVDILAPGRSAAEPVTAEPPPQTPPPATATQPAATAVPDRPASPTPAVVAKAPEVSTPPMAETPKAAEPAESEEAPKKQTPGLPAAGEPKTEPEPPDALRPTPLSPVRQGILTPPKASPSPPSAPTPVPESAIPPAPPPSAAAPASPGPSPSVEAGMAQPTPLPTTRPQPLEPEAPSKTTPAEPTLPAASVRPPAVAVPPPPTDAVTVRIDWDEPAAAAVFRRADFLWVVFDKPSQLDVAALRKAAGNVVRTIERIPAGKDATVLRIDTIAGVNPSLRRDGLAWLLDFRRQPLEPQTVIEARAEPNATTGARLFLPVPQPGDAIVIPDPEVGDTIVAVPVMQLGQGVAQRHEYPQFSILPSGQGIAIQSLIDTLRVRPMRRGVELTSSGPLHISAVEAIDAAAVKLAPNRPLTRVLDLKKWQEIGVDQFLEVKRRLQAEAAMSEGATRQRARMDMARFFVAQGFGAEALGVLRNVVMDRPGAVNEPEFRALHGASNFLMARYGDSRSDWSHAALNGNDEAIFWRAYFAARDGDYVQASRVLRATGAILRDYPKALMMPLALTAVEAAIQVGDIRQASHLLEVLNLEIPTPAGRAQIALAEGRLMELAGDFEGAIAKWEEVELGPHRPSQARATVARTELLYKAEKLTRPELINALEKLRFWWRGDDFEFSLLRRLGDLYLEEKDFRNGLRTLRQAATHFRDHKDAMAVTKTMTDAFARLYLGGEADVLPPVTAIALYDEFKELTPVGEKGDEMIRKLADRLVAVDLLDRAAELLSDQIEFRLKGEQKTRVGTQLALIRIMANQPDQAISALDKSEMDGLQDELATQRRHLRARALIQMDAASQALALLETDPSSDAERLRAEIYWDSHDWPRAARSLARLVKAAGIKLQAPLTDEQAALVLNQAVALALAGNERALDRSRADYLVAMDASPYKDAFRLISSPSSDSALNPQAVAAKVTTAENFRSFLAAYRERLKTQNLSDLFNGPIEPPTG